MDLVIDFDPDPSRDLATIDFSDIVAAAYTGFDHVASVQYPDPETDSVDVIVLHFAADLTATEQAAVRRRLSSSPNEETLRGRAQAALDTNATFLALTGPTNAQVLAQVRALTRECTALIRLVLDQFDSTTGT